jgi:hemin uptake protein HemP
MTEDRTNSDYRMPALEPYCSPPQSAVVTIRSEDLFQGRIEVLIAHGDEIYRLRRTRSGKLILQK